MADKKISGLTPSGPITGSEEIELNQGGLSVKSTLTNLGNLANTYVGLDVNKEISLTNSISGAYEHEFINSDPNGYCFFRASNDSNKEIALAVFGSTSNPTQLYTGDSAWISATAPVAGFINEQVGSAIIFAVGGATLSNESMRVTSAGIKIFTGKAIEFDTTAGGYIGRTSLDKIGKWGVTPIVQPDASNTVDCILNSNAGPNVITDTDTFEISTGSGTQQYTLQQIIELMFKSGCMKI